MSDIYQELEKNYIKIEKYFTEETLLEFLYTPKTALHKYNIGLGTTIRLKLLSPKSVLYKKFIKAGITDREEMSLIILANFHKYIRKQFKQQQNYYGNNQ